MKFSKLFLSLLTLPVLYTFAADSSKPNIVIIYLDDLGYGDISCNGGKIHTPNIDTLVNNGIKFTNAYATSATSTPSRYGLLTGIYPWRNKDAKILPGTAPLLIDVEQQTLPKALRSVGYHTAVINKWHLGMGTGIVDWNKKITPGPNEVGFDYSCVIAATQDRVPTVYIENGYVVGLEPNDPIQVDYDKNFDGEPTGKMNPELLKMKWHHGHNSSIVNGIPRIGYAKGGKSANWVDEDMGDYFLAKAQDYVKANKTKPFFLFYAMHQPHVPRTPHQRFVGTSGLGPRGDVIVEADWGVGQIIKTLKEEGIFDNTLIIFSSDNGAVLNDGYYDDAVEKLGSHKPNGPLRGGKYSLYEAGTRVPFSVSWSGKIKPRVSDAMVCQIDLLESLASLVGAEVKPTDSQNLLNVFMGKSNKGRKNLVIEANTKTAFRKGDWLMIPPYKGEALKKEVNIEIGCSTNYQLYNLKKDISQKNDLATKNLKLLNKLIKEFQFIRGDYSKIETIELK